MNLARIAVILLFAMTFTLIGWTAPVLYATYAPTDQIIDVHSYEAQDTTTESTQHYVCFDRTVNNGISADVVTELYLLDANENKIEINTDTTTTFFQQGTERVIVPRELPDNLREGEYRYVIVLDLDMADGRVTRTMSFESSTFMVEDGPPVESEPPDNCR